LVRSQIIPNAFSLKKYTEIVNLSEVIQTKIIHDRIKLIIGQDKRYFFKVEDTNEEVKVKYMILTEEHDSKVNHIKIKFKPKFANSNLSKQQKEEICNRLYFTLEGESIKPDEKNYILGLNCQLIDKDGARLKEIPYMVLRIHGNPKGVPFRNIDQDKFFIFARKLNQYLIHTDPESKNYIEINNPKDLLNPNSALNLKHNEIDENKITFLMNEMLNLFKKINNNIGNDQTINSLMQKWFDLSLKYQKVKVRASERVFTKLGNTLQKNQNCINALDFFFIDNPQGFDLEGVNVSIEIPQIPVTQPEI